MILIQGEDKTIQFDLKDAAGNAVNFSDLQQVTVKLMQQGRLIASYTKTTISGLGRVQSVSGNPTRCKVLLTRDITHQLKPGYNVNLQVTTFNTDTDYVALRAESTQAVIYQVKEGY